MEKFPGFFKNEKFPVFFKNKKTHMPPSPGSPNFRISDYFIKTEMPPILVSVPVGGAPPGHGCRGSQKVVSIL